MLYTRDPKTKALTPVGASCLELHTPDGKLAAVFSYNDDVLTVLEPGDERLNVWAKAVGMTAVTKLIRTDT